MSILTLRLCGAGTPVRVPLLLHFAAPRSASG